MTIQDIKEKYDILGGYSPKEIVIPDLSKVKGVVLLVGSSGSGKTTILKHYGIDFFPLEIDPTKSIIEHFSTPSRGEELLLSVGLRTIPPWFRPFHEVSNGERYRAESALALDMGVFLLDEFTSVVDRDTAKSLSISIRKGFNSFNLQTLFIGSCHRDIIPWLLPDFIYDTDSQDFISTEGLRRPTQTFDIHPSNTKEWVYFSKFHYLDSTMSRSVHCYSLTTQGGLRVGFLAIIHGTGRDIPSYWRESRLVIIPEFQGRGLGTALSDAVAHWYTSRGLRYFSKTAHPALGEHRQKSPLWRPTSTNLKSRPSYLKKDGGVRLSPSYGGTRGIAIRDSGRVCYSHEFISDSPW